MARRDHSVEVALSPIQVIDPGAGVTDITGGFTEALCAVYSSDGQAYCLGRHGTATHYPELVRTQLPWAPCPNDDPLPSLPGACLTEPTAYATYGMTYEDLKGLTVGKSSKCMINGQELACWGSFANGQLGTDMACPNCAGLIVPEGIAIPGGERSLRKPEFVALGDETACVILSGGRLACWGRNDRGQAGTGEVNSGEHCTVACERTPRMIDHVEDVIAVTLGARHTCAVKLSGELFCWGDNSNGQLAVESDEDPCGDVDCVRVPRRVTHLNDVIDVAAGDRHTCAVTRQGSIWCWGSNQFGQLGLGVRGGPRANESDDVAIPVLVGVMPQASGVTARLNSTCARSSSGRVFCWGENKNAQLGTRCSNVETRPIEIPTRD